MSRALDPKVKVALKQGDHTPVYQCIADVLSTQHDELLDIEVLGPSHALPDDTYLLSEDHAIAIPKVNILRAFIPAYAIIKEHLQGNHDSPEELMRATSVILLLDPEHMTAANARKRHIQNAIKKTIDNIDEALDKELYFVDSLLTSRLHRHTKSPTLWGHRQWLLEQYLARQRHPMRSLATTLERLIFVSAERHPRNYYAWCHARYLLGLAHHHPSPQGNGGGDEQGRWRQQQHTLQEKDAAATLKEVTELVKKWCFNHHNDISGWAFLMVLVEEQPQVAGAVFCETLHLAETFSWRGESVWYFLRTMLRGNWLDGETHGMEFARVLGSVHRMAVGELDERVHGNMLEWSRRFSELSVDQSRK
ncbi:hypothetical protein NQ176_g9175 [Zarea fungicola]|uniref:Uncharacterized protein n=1 Tax=Zarea fungicola TaxID=93591 RepID=A0ACC1MQ38_9HYPO|nr:hypothetical protein NQ176_g9175 [Lecanicillium fungicola]